MIPENDKLDAPDLEAVAVSASVDAGANPAFELSKPNDPSSHEAWCDVEDNFFVDENLCAFPPLK